MSEERYVVKNGKAIDLTDNKEYECNAPSGTYLGKVFTLERQMKSVIGDWQIVHTDEALTTAKILKKQTRQFLRLDPAYLPYETEYPGEDFAKEYQPWALIADEWEPCSYKSAYEYQNNFTEKIDVIYRRIKAQPVAQVGETVEQDHSLEGQIIYWQGAYQKEADNVLSLLEHNDGLQSQLQVAKTQIEALKKEKEALTSALKKLEILNLGWHGGNSVKIAKIISEVLTTH